MYVSSNLPPVGYWAQMYDVIIGPSWRQPTYSSVGLTIQASWRRRHGSRTERVKASEAIRGKIISAS